MKRKVTWKRTAAIATCALLLGATTAGGFASLPAGAASGNHYTVDLEKQLQEFDGWGLSLSWWATEIGDWTRMGSSGKQKREEIAEALYGKSGLNLNIARYNIGGGDDPAHTHMSDDRNTPGWKGATKTTYTAPDGNEYPLYAVDDKYYFEGENGETLDWTQVPDHRQLWVLDWIQNEHGENGQDDYISEFYSNSPPYWMTIAGCSSGGAGGGQNLDDENNQAFVEYFLDVYEYLTEQGFTFGNLQPFNESGSNFWSTNGDQEGCYFSPQQKVKVLALLRQEMEARGLDVPYNWGDETNTNVAYEQYSSALAYSTTDSEGNAVRGEDIVHGADRYTYHIYWYDMSGVQRMYRTAKADGKELYMSEICWSDSADDGTNKYDPESLTTGFHYTQSIIDTVKHGGVDAYVFWQGMEDMVGQMKGNTNYGLIQGVYYTPEEAEAQGVDLASMGLTYQDFVLSKAYYMSGQYTKYIRQGYHMVDVNENNTLAAVSPDGKTLVVVKQNNSNEGETFTLDLNGFRASSVEKVYTDKTHSWASEALSTNGSSVNDTVSARSVTTYIIHGTSEKGNGHFVDESAFKNMNSIGDIAAAIEAAPETERVYSTGFSDGSTSSESVYFGHNAYSNNGTIAVRFYGTGLAAVTMKKSDAAQLNIYIDPEDPNALGEPTVFADLHADSASAGNLVGRKNGLEAGWHTAYIKPVENPNGGGTWVNLDGLCIYTAPDVPEETGIDVTSAAARGGEVKFTYELKGIDELQCDLYVELFQKGSWVRNEAATVEEGTGSFTTSDDVIRMRIVAAAGGEILASSPERILKMMTATEGVLYFVDCATADPSALATGAALGTAQGVSDQPYGADTFSGLNWGYTGSYTAYYDQDEAMSSIWSLDKVRETKIEYKFTIPEAGTYNVTLGFFGGGNGWGERAVKATVKGAEQNATLKAETYNTLLFTLTTTVADEEIVISVEKQDSKQNASHLAAIVIAEQNVKVPLYTSGVSDFNSYAGGSEDVVIGENVFDKLNEKEFTLYYSDGTSEELARADAEISVEITTIALNQTVKAAFLFEEQGIECRAAYRWTQAGGVQLYYNIDCGYVDGSTPPDDATLLGTFQSTTHDREFGPDGSHSWGYVGSHYGEGVNWKDDKDSRWSIREGKDEGQSVAYKMTGFKPDELLHIDIAGHCSDWGNRTANVYCNDVLIGDWTLISASGGTITNGSFEGENVKADAKGELVFKLARKSGDGPQIGYIRVSSVDLPYPVDSTITTENTVVEREDTITLSGLNTNGTVYVTDENGMLVGAFKPTAAEQQIKVSDYLPETSDELHFTQAEPNVTNLSAELVVTVDRLDIEIILETGWVRGGDAAVVRFIPHTTNGVTALTLATLGGTNLDMTEGFFYRAKENGTYVVTLLSGGVTFEKQFVVDNIDEVDYHAEYSTEGWTKDPVTVTFAPTAKSGVVSVLIDGAAAAAQSGKYSLTADENGEHTVTVTTEAGFTYEETFAVNNIDKTEPTVSFELDFSQGLGLNFEAVSASGGSIHAKLNGKETVITDLSSFSLAEEGKYELSFVNGAGVATQTAVYYVTYGAEKANLATVTVGKDGTVSVTDKAKAALDYKLYRAGEDTPVAGNQAVKAGKYYLEIDKDGEKEIVVLTVEKNNSTGSVKPVQPGFTDTTKADGNIGLMIGGIVVGCVALVAAAVVCIMLIKGRKNS